MQRKIQVLILLFLLFTIIIVNIRATLDNYYGFYFSREKDLVNQNPLYKTLSFIESNRIYRLFTTYSGLETGYGFFAPNVASEFIVSFTLYDRLGNKLDSIISLNFRNKESFMRMIGAYSMFFNYNTKDSLSTEYQKCLILLKGLSRKRLLQTANAVSVKTDLFLYHYPLLKELKSKWANTPVYFLYASKMYQLNEYAGWK